MRVYLCIASVIVYCFSTNPVLADEVRVSPGVGTLQAAISAANIGDTLVLEDGGYEGVTTVNKSLIIRPLNRSTNSTISDVMIIEGAGIEITLQGLIFTGHIDVNQGGSVNILENELTSGSIITNDYLTSQGDGSLVIIGNRLTQGNIGEINSEGSYIAGNILYSGSIEANSYVWVVGNHVLNHYDSSGVGYAAIYTKGPVSNIIANRIRASDSYSTYGIRSTSSTSFIAANIIEINDTTTSTYTQMGIFVESGNATIVNNVIQGTPGSATRSGAAIYTTTSEARISGNIVLNYISSSIAPIASTAPIWDISNNLCFNSSGICPEGDGNISVNPMFVDIDSGDYSLLSGSPAIDAGPTDYSMADLDRTRNDMGAYGGPWSIGQYDAQRDPDNYTPYVYPLFKSESVISGGVLEVQALGVARLR